MFSSRGREWHDTGCIAGEVGRNSRRGGDDRACRLLDGVSEFDSDGMDSDLGSIAASRNGAEIGIHAIAIELANAIKQPARTIVAASTRVAADLASDAPSIVPLTATAGKHPTKAGLK